MRVRVRVRVRRTVRSSGKRAQRRAQPFSSALPNCAAVGGWQGGWKWRRAEKMTRANAASRCSGGSLACEHAHVRSAHGLSPCVRHARRPSQHLLSSQICSRSDRGGTLGDGAGAHALLGYILLLEEPAELARNVQLRHRLRDGVGVAGVGGVMIGRGGTALVREPRQSNRWHARRRLHCAWLRFVGFESDVVHVPQVRKRSRLKP
jgi:hypothetical protein